jgi:hypothetical protein
VIARLRLAWTRLEPAERVALGILPLRALILWLVVYAILVGTWDDRRVLALLLVGTYAAVEVAVIFVASAALHLAQRARGLRRVVPTCADCGSDDVVPQPPSMGDGPGPVDPTHARAWERYARVLEAAILDHQSGVRRIGERRA